MINIRSFDCGRAHELIVRKIMKDGIEIITEDEEKTTEAIEPVNIHISDPLSSYPVSKHCLFQEKAMKAYVDSLIYGDRDTGFAYTYHDRLFNYQIAEDIGCGLQLHSFDQINSVIEKLSQNPQSRRAQAITWDVYTDAGSHNPPCLQRVQFLIRDDVLNMYVEFRSNDMLSALGANMYALTHLQKYVAEHLDIPTGWYSHTSVSAHIYHVRDEYELRRFTG